MSDQSIPQVTSDEHWNVDWWSEDTIAYMRGEVRRYLSPSDAVSQIGELRTCTDRVPECDCMISPFRRAVESGFYDAYGAAYGGLSDTAKELHNHFVWLTVGAHPWQWSCIFDLDECQQTMNEERWLDGEINSVDETAPCYYKRPALRRALYELVYAGLVLFTPDIGRPDHGTLHVNTDLSQWRVLDQDYVPPKGAFLTLPVPQITDQDAHSITDTLIARGRLSRQFNQRPPMNEWMELRSLVFERDDYTCLYCGKRGGDLHCDHVIPLARGGTNDPDNLVTACAVCNLAKHAKTVEEWLS